MPKIIQLKDETGADAYPVTGANMVNGLANVAKTGNYNDLSNYPAMSTDVEADGTSDTKTSTPKSVKTFVEGKGYYTKPQSGIPASDIADGVIPDISDLATETEVSQLRSEKADKDGYYPEMSVGSLKGTEVTQVEGITTIAKSTGIAKFNEVMGRSLVWNQLVQNGDFSDGTTRWEPTTGANFVVANQEGVLTVAANGLCRIRQAMNLFLTHKYYIRATLKSDASRTIFLQAGEKFATFTVGSEYKDYAAILSPVSSAAQGCVVGFYNDAIAGDVLKYKYVYLIDLTQMFSGGNEPATVEEFEALYPLSYYIYNPGEIISNNTEALEITGLNQWDGTYVDVGYYLDANGDCATSQNYNTTDYIKVSPNTAYYAKDFFLQSASAPRLCWYDAEKNFISSAPWSSSNIYISPSNASYIRLSIARAQASTACLSISGSRNGEYEPYQKSELELNLVTITGKLNGEGESVVIFPDGMRSAGTAFDSLIVDEDGWCRRAVTRLAEVDMGTLTWFAADPETSTERQSSNSLQSILAGAEATAIANLLSTKYIAVSANSTYLHQKDMSISAVPSGTIFVYNSSLIGHTAEEIKSAMSGVKLIYPLATPQEYVLDTPIQMTFQAKHGGVIRQLPENGSAPTTTPMRMSVTYALDAVSILTDLPENYVSKESLQAMLSAMQSAGLFSAYTMTFNESTGKYEFTFTANA